MEGKGWWNEERTGWKRRKRNVVAQWRHRLQLQCLNFMRQVKLLLRASPTLVTNVFIGNVSFNREFGPFSIFRPPPPGNYFNLFRGHSLSLSLSVFFLLSFFLVSRKSFHPSFLLFFFFYPILSSSSSSSSVLFFNPPLVFHSMRRR